MKKIMMLALVLTTIATTAFSNNSDAINQKVLNAFTKSFTLAENVKWEVRKDLYKATFQVNGQVMFAYFSEDGEQLAVTRNIKVDQLPITLANDLQQGYHQYWLTDLFEVSAKGQTSYYATIHSATHVTILKAEGATSWMVFKKDKKN